MLLEPEKRKKFERFISKLDENLKVFWSKYGKTMMAKGRHTDFFIEPAMLIGDEVNPEVVKRVALVYLAKMTPEQVLADQAVVMEDKIIINSESGKKAMEVFSEQLIDGMSNKVINALGSALAQKNYLLREGDGRYSYGEIKDALRIFLEDYEKGDSKNILKDAIILLRENKEPERLVHSASASSDQNTAIPNPLARKKKRIR